MGLNDYLKIGDKIKKYRKEMGMTQKEMALRLNIPYSTYSNYENNNRVPNEDILDKITEILNITVNDLFIINDDNYGVYMEFVNFIIEWAYKRGYSANLSHKFQKTLENGGGQSVFIEKDKKLYEFTPKEILSYIAFLESFFDVIICEKQESTSLYPEELKKLIEERNALSFLNSEE